jgi:tRNA(Ile2)-agmatinylcytidine synthase
VTVIGLDDTDSREGGMCTTYVAHRLATEIEAVGGSVERVLLVRLNPAVEYKTRGNAALAIHCDTDPATALELGAQTLDLAITSDDRTNPGLVVADRDPANLPATVSEFASSAVTELCSPERAEELCAAAGFQQTSRGTGRGIVGALAAVGAWAAFDDWTYECISYRERERWGSQRDVDAPSVYAAADSAYPAVWDTVDRVEEETVCVPRTPCPILHGIRGDDPEAVIDVAESIESEPVAERRVFVTNQGTDAHITAPTDGAVENDGAYRIDATVSEAPGTREGGHVFLGLETAAGSLQAAAFEPTKRFRDHVRSLRSGDRITACGEVQSGTLKLEKFAVRELVTSEEVTPDCPSCGLSMKSAGADAGYRCRDCNTSAPGQVRQAIDRTLDEGWYEVPPCARRHIAKPLVRGGFDGPTHPAR